jgi:hypothetical protein
MVTAALAAANGKRSSLVVSIPSPAILAVHGSSVAGDTSGRHDGSVTPCEHATLRIFTMNASPLAAAIALLSLLVALRASR